MISDIKKRGFDAGYKAAKEAKERGTPNKQILKMVVDDKQIAKQLMEEFKISREKGFRFGVVYSFGYDRGIAEAVYE